MIGFINVFVPLESSQAGSKYFTFPRCRSQTLALFKQSVADISQFCNQGIYIFVDITALTLTKCETNIFYSELKASCLCPVLGILPHQITNRDVYCNFFNKLKSKHGSKTLIFYSGNHDHILSGRSAEPYLDKTIGDLKDATNTIIFPTHFPEFKGLEFSKNSYLGFKKTSRLPYYKANSVFSFMIAPLELLAAIFSKNIPHAFIPRIDWKGVNSRINHFCILPNEEVFFHADGLSHIGIDNLVSPPSNSSDEYSYSTMITSLQMIAIEKQEKAFLRKTLNKQLYSQLIEARQVFESTISDLSGSHRFDLLVLLRQLNSYIYHASKSTRLTPETIGNLPVELITKNYSGFYTDNLFHLMKKRFLLLLETHSS